MIPTLSNNKALEHVIQNLYFIFRGSKKNYIDFHVTDKRRSILQNIFFCVPQNKVRCTCLEQQ